MKTKSFFADRIHDALAAAHRHLGPDAVLLSSHRAPVESKHLGAFEVVCGCRETTDPAPDSDYGATRARNVCAPAFDSLRAKSFIEELLSIPPGGADAPGSTAHVEASFSGAESGLISWQRVEHRLLDEGLPTSMANEMIRGLKTELRGLTVKAETQACSNGASHRNAGASVTQLRLQLKAILPLLDDYADPDPGRPAPSFQPQFSPSPSRRRELVSLNDLNRAIRSFLNSRLRQPPPHLHASVGIKTLALVGPSGSGKTMLAIKLAVDATIRRARPVRFVAVAGSTPGSTRMMESISSLVGCPFSLVENPHQLLAACLAKAENELLIIDTPGFSVSQEAERRTWTSALAQVQPCEVALVMPATMKVSDLFSAARQYEPFRPTLLGFAHADQTDSLCACLALAISAGLPVGYLSNGQEIPEDLETPSAAQFLGRSAPVFQGELAQVS